MASMRDKRANAGSKMAMLLENEDNDDFYSNAYGGFLEEEDDAEYSEEDDLESDTDSDISIDENDEPVSDHEDEDNKKRQMRVVTKAYKEPAKVKKEIKKVLKLPKHEKLSISDAPIERKRMRESTTQKSLEVKKRRLESLKNQDLNKRKPSEYRVLTQEQLLEEAKITELKNLKSLEMFQRLELEKKKSKVIKPTYTGPMIRYHSTTMPAIEEIEDENGQTQNKIVGKCSRNFITFTDEHTMKDIFKFEKPKPVQRSTCIVTRLPARYIDPLTKQPSANLTGFRIIREAYYTQLEKKIDPRQPQVAKWLEWRKQMKSAKQNKTAL